MNVWLELDYYKEIGFFSKELKFVSLGSTLEGHLTFFFCNPRALLETEL